MVIDSKNISTSNPGSPSIKQPAWIQRHLSEQEIAQIEAAVATAEKTTAGEIVPIIVRRSVELRYHAIMMSLIFVFIFGLYAESLSYDWMHYSDVLLVFLGFLVSGLAGYLLSKMSFVRRILITDMDARRLANLRAEVEFYRADIGRTKDSTGILLFLSLEERHAVVLADKSISKILPQDTWEKVLQHMVNGLKSGGCAEGMMAAISLCGSILTEALPIKEDDTNELPNKLLILE